jgi:hypothetical protein
VVVVEVVVVGVPWSALGSLVVVVVVVGVVWSPVELSGLCGAVLEVVVVVAGALEVVSVQPALPAAATLGVVEAARIVASVCV